MSEVKEKPHLVHLHRPGDREGVKQFLLQHEREFTSWRRVLITPQGTLLEDMNRRSLYFQGLTYGDPALETLLHLVGVNFDPRTLHDPSTTLTGEKEFRVTAVYPWGYDRPA